MNFEWRSLALYDFAAAHNVVAAETRVSGDPDKIADLRIAKVGCCVCFWFLSEG